ncbi:hypothetical protein M422DRAFT_269704 [Sphaerobolus stellatus SS14]|uniref:Uncharacterized protein n=1 Tax=Sphaerobolus stellatus (strain SS14) TaxID=990650 RepID=A0A0C9UJ62_SPHS4|nr:hypothetical protein M422DRAFT_269704 [Sphaerobolus stellatus SS14]
MSARKLFSCLQLPRHASYAAPALGNATRQVHAVFGPVESGIDVKNGSFSVERTMSLQHRETLRTETISPQSDVYYVAVAWRQLLRRSSMHPHPDTQDATCPFLYGSDDLHDALYHSYSPKSINDGSYPASLCTFINSLISPRLQLLHIDLYHSRSLMSIDDAKHYPSTIAVESLFGILDPKVDRCRRDGHDRGEIGATEGSAGWVDVGADADADAIFRLHLPSATGSFEGGISGGIERTTAANYSGNAIMPADGAVCIDGRLVNSASRCEWRLVVWQRLELTFGAISVGIVQPLLFIPQNHPCSHSAPIHWPWSAKSASFPFLEAPMNDTPGRSLRCITMARSPSSPSSYGVTETDDVSSKWSLVISLTPFLSPLKSSKETLLILTSAVMFGMGHGILLLLDGGTYALEYIL